jgi:hypothetical protein
MPMNPNDEQNDKASITPRGDPAPAYPGGVGRGTGGRYDEKRDPPFSETEPPFAGHAASEFSEETSGAVDVPVTDSGVDNSGVDEFTTGGDSLGHNAGASRDVAPSVSETIHDSGRRPPDANA